MLKLCLAQSKTSSFFTLFFNTIRISFHKLSEHWVFNVYDFNFLRRSWVRLGHIARSRAFYPLEILVKLWLRGWGSFPRGSQPLSRWIYKDKTCGHNKWVARKCTRSVLSLSHCQDGSLPLPTPSFLMAPRLKPHASAGAKATRAFVCVVQGLLCPRCVISPPTCDVPPYLSLNSLGKGTSYMAK